MVTRISLCLTLFVLAAAADIITTATGFGGSASIARPTMMGVQLGVSGPFSALLHPLFEEAVIDLSSAGTSYVSNAANDPDFGAFVAFVTNGSNDRLLLRSFALDSTNPSFPNPPYPTGGQGPLETSFFRDHPGIDLAGYRIDAIVFHIDTVEAWAPVPTVTGFKWTHGYEFHGTPVPEPAVSLLVAFAGGVWLVFGRRGRRRRTNGS